MADISKLKQKSRLPDPPSMEEASGNLSAPEHGPTPPPAAATQRQTNDIQKPGPASSKSPRIDGRSARRSNRTVQFATRVTQEFDDRIRHVAAREGLLLVEVMERALDAYDKN